MVCTFLAEHVLLVAVDCRVTELFGLESVAEIAELEAAEHIPQRRQRGVALWDAAAAGRLGSFVGFAFEAEAQVPLVAEEEGLA